MKSFESRVLAGPDKAPTNEALAGGTGCGLPVQEEGDVAGSQRCIQQIIPRLKVVQIHLPEGGHLRAARGIKPSGAMARQL